MSLKSSTHFFSFSLLLICALALTAGGAQAFDLGGHDRDGIVVGVDLGIGWNKIQFTTPGGEGETDTESSFSGGLNVGWAPNDNFIYSIGMYGWKKSFYEELTPITATTFHFIAELSVFPLGEGFWVKGGVGIGNLDFSFVLPAERITFQESGLTLIGGVGYEFRMADQIAAGLAYNYRQLTVGAFEGLENTRTDSQNLTFSLRYYY